VARPIETSADKKRYHRRRRFGRVTSRKWPSGRRTWRALWFCKVERRRLSRSFDSEKEAKDFLAELERRIVARAYEVPPTIQEVEQKDADAKAAARPRTVPTLIEYTKHVMGTRLEPVLAVGSLGMYESALKAWTKWFGAREGRRAMRLDEITPSVWLDYRSWRANHRQSPHGKKTAVGPRCLNSDLQCLVRVLNFAVIDGHLEHNPLAGTKKLREPRRPRRYLTKGEIALLLQNCEERFRPLLLAMVYTGARKGELTALRWRDLDFEGGKIALFRPKVGNSDYIDLHPALAAELTRVSESRTGDDGKGPPSDGHVFLSRHGTPWVDIRKSWALALKAAGLAGRPGLTPHAVRHSFATHFLEGGGSVTDLMTQLGHSKLETTQIYAAAVSERRRATVLAMEFGA
jgi:integrase